MAPAVLEHPGARTKRSKLLIEKRIAQPNQDDQDGLGTILEMMERVERKAETLIEPELRDVLEPGIERLLGVLRSGLRY
ncbi:hypothetical protein GBA65_17870 [Rubrobacter marinus]|uniref:Uncharacterized protein n=1 Tax=Rubrobacter marinus TaxID=2653852 RepID=A0A6G8Q0W4_9ACTN|nr:hypothetical protein [Rubrobacter marinus]QIN80078.1 hypothetical protein GBA65_17870 [Rubrobacter marinus]